MVLARPGVQGLFILNESAAFLWSLLAEELPFSHLLSRFCRQYGLSEEDAANDVSAALAFWNSNLLSPPAQEGFHPLNAVPSDAFSELYRVNGRLIRVSVSDPDLAAEIFPRLESVHATEAGEPELTFEVSTQDGRVSLFHQGELVCSEENPNAIRAILLQEMVRRTERDQDWLAILHAGACGLEDNVLLFAGKSQAGKTTLCAALMAGGFKFYCDDSAALARRDGTISPMPFRMMIRQGSWDVLRSRFPELTSSEVSQRYGQAVRFLAPPPGQIASAPAKAKALLFVSYQPGEKTSLRPLLPFETLLKVQESGFWVQHDRDSIDAFLLWLQKLPAYGLVYSNLEDAISKIRDFCADPVAGVAS